MSELRRGGAGGKSVAGALSTGAGGAANPRGNRRSPQAIGRAGSELTALSRSTLRRSLGSPVLFAIVWTPLASAIYFSLGVVADHALWLTPLVFVIAAVMFGLTAMTYVEGASLHQDRGGSTVFARYAFNELVSFIAGWAILLDYIILIAVTAYTATQYLRVFWSPLGNRAEALGLALAIIASSCSATSVASRRRARRVGILVAGDLVLQCLMVVIGLVLFFSPHTLLDPIHLGSAPEVVGPGVRADDRDVSLHQPGVRLRAGRRGEDQPPRAAPPGRQRHRIGARSCTSGSRWWRSPRYRCMACTPRWPPLPERPDDRDHHADAPALAGAAAALHGRRAGRADAGGGRQLGDARPVAAGLLAVDEPPDTQRPGTAAPAALHPIRADHSRRGARRGAGGAGEHRLPGRYLRVRCDARVHDRPPVGLPAALLRARPRPPLPHPLSIALRGGELPLPAGFGALLSAAGWSPC